MAFGLLTAYLYLEVPASLLAGSEENRWYWCPKVESYGMKTTEKIVLHLKLVRVMGVLLAYVIWCHVKVAHISPEYGAYLNLTMKWLPEPPLPTRGQTYNYTRTAQIESILTTNVIHKSGNALVCQILLKVFTDMDAHAYRNREKVCRMCKQYTLMYTSNFSALTMLPGSLQKEKERCKVLTMMVNRKDGIGKSMLHSTRNSMPSWRALQIMATV